MPSFKDRNHLPKAERASGKFGVLRPKVDCPLHPLHSAVRVLENRMGRPYSKPISHPYFEAILRCPGDSRQGLEHKERWLKEKFGLVPENPHADPGMEKLAHITPEDPLTILMFYEDGRIAGEHKGAWNVRCRFITPQDNPKFSQDTSEFYFRMRNEGKPEILGEDTMADAVRQFHEEFIKEGMDGIYQLGSNYKVEFDWKLIYEMAADGRLPYTIKKFP